MAAGPLALSPALRPWYAAGLRYVYFDDEALKALGASKEVHAVPNAIPSAMSDTQTAQSTSQSKRSSQPNRPDLVQQQTTAVRYADRTPPQAGLNSRRQAAQRQDHTNQDWSQNRAHNEEQQSPQANAQSNRLAHHLQEGPQATTIPLDQWPQIWQERITNTLATAKGAPVLWTYWALGEDLSGAPNAPRRDILRRILGELNLPRGTHCFWPLAMPCKELTSERSSQYAQEGETHNAQTDIELQANAPIFLAGLDILAPRVCVIMGSKALRTIIPNSTTGPFQQTQYGRMLFLVLPDMDMLLAESERIPRVVAYLRSALQPFMGRR